MRSPLTWAVAAMCSLGLHGAVGAALVWSVDPEPVNDQPVPETQMQLSAHQVRQSKANEAQPDLEAAEAENAEGSRLSANTIARSQATEAAPSAQKLNAARPEGLSVSALEQSGKEIAAVEATVEIATAISASPQIVASTPVQVAAENLSLATAPTQAVVLSRPTSQAAVALEAEPIALTQTVPDVPVAKASDVFSAGDGATIDPVSLAAFQSFMNPEDAGQNAQDLRDGIDGLLDRVPCARLQVQFQPDTNTLELIGHIPEDGLRSPVLKALQTQMGDNIRVADNLLILPRPQCGALSGIGEVGLPQSTDQITNPLLVGEDVHARAFRYTQGQQLVLELTGADYDAYIYVDYFDADGQVIHLSPNDSVPLERVPAKSAIRVGAQNQGDPGLFITIGPPYGQEIAVAFAASEPLFDDPRPLVEPAEPYLKFLKERVAEARSSSPDFKGEWVYFFITTAER